MFRLIWPHLGAALGANLLLYPLVKSEVLKCP
jgi:hypothetical protein